MFDCCECCGHSDFHPVQNLYVCLCAKGMLCGCVVHAKFSCKHFISEREVLCQTVMMIEKQSGQNCIT